MDIITTGKEIVAAVEAYIANGGFFNNWTELPTIVLGKEWPGKTGAGFLRQSDDQDNHVKAYRYHLLPLAEELWGKYLREEGKDLPQVEWW